MSVSVCVYVFRRKVAHTITEHGQLVYCLTFDGTYTSNSTAYTCNEAKRMPLFASTMSSAGWNLIMCTVELHPSVRFALVFVAAAVVAVLFP